jgi:Na+/melibiose symporter-like transporter
MSPILGLSFMLLLLPSLIIDLSDPNAIFVWLLAWYQIFNISYGVTSPYDSWMAEQFRVDERPRASQYQNTLGFIGTSVISAFSMVVLTSFINKIQENPAIIPPEFLYSVIIFGIASIVLFYLVSFLMPTEHHFKIESNLVQTLRRLLQNKNFLLVTGMQGISSIATITITGIMLMYLVEVLNFNSIDYYIAAAILIFGILFFLYVWKTLVQKLGKKRSLSYIFSVAIIVLPLTLLGLIPMNSYFVFGIIFILGLAGTLGGWALFPAMMYADIAEDDEVKSGELKPGIYAGFPSITLNLFQALGLFIMGIMLELPAVGNLTYSFGLVLWGPICSGIFIITLLYTRKFITLDFDWEKNKK